MGKKNKQRANSKKAQEPGDKISLKKSGKKLVEVESEVPKKQEKYSVDKILDKVNEYIDTFQYDLAQKFCQRALEMDSDNLRVLETSGTLLLEVGEMEKAKHCFGRAIELSPEQGHSKYMYMGQLMTGHDSIQYFVKGIELMKKTIEGSEQDAGACAHPKEDGVTSSDISTAYCSLAEIYLTDQCFDGEAETKCKECLDNALKQDSENAEAHHLYTSYWLSKHDTEKAKESMSRGLSLWLPQWRDVCEKCDGQEEVDLTDACSLTYPARINVTKLLVELEDYNTASEILELLLDEEDEVVETWYLLGWVHYLQGGDYKQNARFYLGKAQKVAKKMECEDTQMVTHVEELLAELGGPVDEEPGEEEEVNGDDMDANSDSDLSDDNKNSSNHGDSEMEH